MSKNSRRSSCQRDSDGTDAAHPWRYRTVLAEQIALATSGAVHIRLLGLEFFLANGPTGVRAISGRPIFLDVKLHDIPNTVAGAVRAILPLGPRMLTLHAVGGAPMIEAPATLLRRLDRIVPCYWL
jgi:orotidine-5'-phosphate decarboxylase